MIALFAYLGVLLLVLVLVNLLLVRSVRAEQRTAARPGARRSSGPPESR